MESSVAELWNGETAKAIRRAMYRNELCEWCKVRGCPILNGNTKIQMNDILTQFRGDLFHQTTVQAIREDRDELPAFPSHLIISNDWRCNLRCVMCDTIVYAANKSAHQSAADVTDRIFDEVEQNLHWIKRMFFSGFGDPLAIRRHRQFLQHATRDYPQLEIELLSNGLLLTPAVWETIKHNRFVTIRVSVDATTKETYEKIRKRGNWDVLVANLRFLGELRRAGDIPGFEINMTVMKDNFHEVYDFLPFGLELGCDCMGLQIIHGQLGLQNFLTPQTDWKIVDYLQEFLGSETAKHPQYYVEFLRHLEDMRPAAELA